MGKEISDIDLINENDRYIFQNSKVIPTSNNGHNTYFYIGYDWNEFKRECNLKVGDYISFIVDEPECLFIDVKVYQK